MANPTTNFGWVMPTSANLIGDLPANFNTFGQGVDTSMLGLLGGTTGQYLAKTSATSMAFTWTTLGAWSTYTPTFTGFTLGNGTITLARYAQVGKVVNMVIVVTLGSTSSVTGQITVSIPVVSSSSSVYPNQMANLYDLSANVQYTGVSAYASGSTIGLFSNNSAGTSLLRVATSSTNPMTWAVGDIFAITFVYEAA